MLEQVAKVSFAQLLNLHLAYNGGIFAAQSAAGVEDLLRYFRLARFEVCEPITVIQLGH
ncbi:hypothetical protein [Sphingobium yanoikuyae]|jgi:hypothetical protein|uniref:Uncharacterized protein n=1 Tax=Sphingobium yanoikuyae TaxID=13690 RepID=A0A9X7UIF4_SPHYA|nr:hypothetical protein [Sphingobium yanoikuyae]QNG48592.1 hypothetical protein H3V42_14370 [Sphingobium yanoikuyae]